jgi:4-amino-4-deoxy-L-arabinose transferase-like glycosyltransferase
MRASCIALAAFALYMVPVLMGRPLVDTPEARIAAVAREMLQSGDWTVPRLNGKLRLIKPPLPYWEAATVATVLGANGQSEPLVYARAVEIASAFLTALAVFIVSLYGCRVLSPTAGALAGTILATSWMVFKYAELGYCDAGLMCFCAGMLCAAASLWTAPKAALLPAVFFGIFLGLGVLQKWFIPFMVLGGPLAYAFLFCRTQRWQKLFFTAVGFAVAALLVAPWFLMLEHRLPGGIQKTIDGVRECANATGHVHKDRWSFYFQHLFGGLLPWTPLVMVTLVWVVRSPRAASGTDLQRTDAVRFFLVAAGFGFVVFYASAKQQPYYLLPLFPALALLSGYLIAELWDNMVIRRATYATAFIAAAGALCYGVIVTQKIKRSEPYSQLISHVRALPADAEVYSTGVNDAMQLHYLGKTFKTFYDLAGQTEAPAFDANRTRFIVIPREALTDWKLDPFFESELRNSTSKILVAPLPPTLDWEAFTATIKETLPKRPVEDIED